jgi:predicted HTH domain antitoxin
VSIEVRIRELESLEASGRGHEAGERYNLAYGTFAEDGSQPSRYNSLMPKSQITIAVDLPSDAKRESKALLAARLRMLWVLDEVRQGRMTRVRAAAVLGISLDDFLREAASHGVDAIDYDLEDFKQELAALP